jgi:hypothetical protein
MHDDTPMSFPRNLTYNERVLDEEKHSCTRFGGIG